MVGGLQPEGEEALWHPTLADPGVQRSLERTKLDSTGAFTDRLVSAFKAHYLERQSGRALNCHAFAASMKNPDSPSDVIEEGSLASRNLKLGEIGMFGINYGDVTVPFHSVIGLGEENDSCIQAWPLKGIGMARYEDLKVLYDNVVESAGDTAFPNGLFVAEG